MAKATGKKFGEEESVTEESVTRPNITKQCLDDPKWTRVFLPTLSHALYVSDQPFTDWTLGSDSLLKTVQDVFDLTFTNISHTLRAQDGVVKAVWVM